MSARERLALDLTVLAIVVAAANPALTGITLHEWLGMVLVVPALTHLIVNWEWVVRAASGFFGRIRTVARVNLVVDAALFVSVVGVTVSGFLVIPGLATSLGIQASSLWHAVHLLSSNLTVAFTVAHFALHAKWMAKVAGRVITPHQAAPGQASRRRAAPAPPAVIYPRSFRPGLS